MKRALLVIVFLSAVISGILAHPPSEIIITFDLDKSMVYADIMHNTNKPAEHFIYMIQVSVNGKKLIKQEAVMQVNNEKQMVAFLIPGLKEGDKVMFDADCNKYGDLQVEAVAKKLAGKIETKVKK